MSGRASVRTHTRKNASGKASTVHQHSRGTKGARRGLTPSHAWKLAKAAGRAARRKKRLTACVLGGLAVGELGAWLTLRGVGLMLATAGVLALGVAAAASAASGGSDFL